MKEYLFHHHTREEVHVLQHQAALLSYRWLQRSSTVRICPFLRIA